MSRYTNTVNECAAHLEPRRNGTLVRPVLAEIEREARELHYWYEQYCNRELSPWEEADCECTEDRIREFADSIGLPVDFNRDPRGFSVHLTLPDGASNSWGGEIWGF